VGALFREPLLHFVLLGGAIFCFGYYCDVLTQPNLLTSRR